jgi:hypothetical protein
MFSTHHNSDRRAAPAEHSRSETPLISPTPTLSSGTTQNSNREWPVRLEFAVTPTKQRPELSSNRHNRAVRAVSLLRNPPARFLATPRPIPHFYSEHTNSRIRRNSFKTNGSDHFYSGQMNTFYNCSAPCVDRPSCVTYNEICAATQRLRSRRWFPFWISRAPIAHQLINARVLTRPPKTNV